MNPAPFLLDGRLDGRFPLPLDAPFTLADAVRAGVRPNALTALVRAGLLRRPVRGVYLAAQAGDSTRLRCACLRLVVPEDATVCDRHAGWLHGAEMVLAPGEHLDLRPISVFLPPDRGRVRLAIADSGERTLSVEDVVELHGLRVTSPLRTALDLGRQRWPAYSLAALDQMLRLGCFTRDDLLGELGRFRGARWVRTLRTTAPLADGRAESPPESVLRLRWIETGLLEPQPQLEVRTVGGLLVARLDLGNEEEAFGAEYDGAEWHSTDEQRGHDRRRRGWARDEGYRIEVFTQANLWGPGQDAELHLRRAVEEHRRARGIPLTRRWTG